MTILFIGSIFIVMSADTKHTFSSIYNAIFTEYSYKNQDKEQTEKLFAQVKETVPEECDFYENWFRAFVSVANNDGKNSNDYFLKALENVDKLKDSGELPIFLQQGFAFFMYIDSKENAKKFWEIGAEKNLFAKPDSEDFYEKFFQRFNSKEQFWVQFAPNMFVDEKKSSEKAINDYRISAKTGDELMDSINDGDFEKFSALCEKTDFSKKKLAGVSPLYYTIQRKGSLRAGVKKFVEDIVNLQADSMISKLNLDSIPNDLKHKQFLEIFHQMRVTYEKSGLGKIMFNALFGKDEELEERTANIEKILDKIIEKTDDVDFFTKTAGNKTSTNALLLSAEIGDTSTMKKLIGKGANVEKICGYANFGMNYKGGKSIKTEIPNSLIYRMINFSQFEALKFYLSEFKDKARKSMTAKSDKCNITPLTFFILNTLYTSRDEESYGKMKALVDEMLPFFLNAGSSLEQNTAFGSAKKLLGM